MMRDSKRKGFTLIELMIILAVLAILASMMMFSSTETVTTAKALSIINNLQTIRKGVIAWYTDNREKVRYMNNHKINVQGANAYDALQIGKYLDDATRNLYLNGSDSKGRYTPDRLADGRYGLFTVEYYRRVWFVGYRFNKGEEAVREKMKARSDSTGLIFSGKYPNPGRHNLSLISDDRDVEGDETVWLYVLGDFNRTERDWKNELSDADKSYLYN